MKQTNHTPGPWDVIPARGKMLPHLMGADHSRIALLDDCHAAENERQANARLIAAAPDLLEALENAANQIKALDEDYDQRSAYLDAMAAIAKATGRAA